MDLVPEDRPAVASHLAALGWLAPDEPLLSLTPAGEGTMNRTLRAATPARTLILKQAVPFVAKHPQTPAPVERLAVESAFYRAISGCSALAIRTPEILGEDPSEHLLCMTDLGPGPSFLQFYNAPVPPGADARGREGALTALIYWLWKLHALSTNPPAADDILQNHAMRALRHRQIFETPLDPYSGVQLSADLDAVRSAFAADAAVTDRARALGSIYLGQGHHDSSPVLLHGSYYPGNWLRHPVMGVMIIDPEWAFFGPPEFDVGVFLAHLTLAGLEQTELMMLMRSYVTPEGFSYPLALAFAGMEVIQRLLGAAQLPLTVGDATRTQWLDAARSLVLGWSLP